MLFKSLLLVALTLVSCSESEDEISVADLTIFFINDQHGQIDNFANIKSIVDAERQIGATILVSAGDIFAGNPIVDQAAEPGSPMIEIMNQVGFEVATLGNHEFDFGIEVLEDSVVWAMSREDAYALYRFPKWGEFVREIIRYEDFLVFQGFR